MNCYKNNNDCCNIKTICCFGPTGPRGATEPTGPAGTSGLLNYADFYALMQPDNAPTVAPGTDVSFPRDGSIGGTNIYRTSASSFNLGLIGTYQILFQVSVDEAGQLPTPQEDGACNRLHL